MKKVYPFLIVMCLLWHGILAQETFPVNGVHDKRLQSYAFTNATIYVDYQTKIENATLILQEGKIIGVGKDVKIPEGAIVQDLEGKFVYPSFIDLHSSYGLPGVRKPGFTYGHPQIEPETKGAYNWNDAIKSYYNAVDEFTVDENAAQELRKIGFGAVLTHRSDGIARGSSSLVALATGEKENNVIIQDKAAFHYSFDKGSSRQIYPGSLMGSISLLRQTYIDAEWYKVNGKHLMFDKAMAAFNEGQHLPQVFDVNHKLSLLRADKVGDEFGVQYIIKGTGLEYQRIKEVKETKAPLIIPVNYPKAYDVDDPFDAMLVSLEELKHWEMAPGNLATLAKNEITFALTSDGLEKKEHFLENVRKALQFGLDEKEALKALTAIPAKLMKADDKIGALKSGMMANFIIASDNIFKEDVTIYENWVKGKKYVINDMTLKDFTGKYTLKISEKDQWLLEISGKPEKYDFKITKDDSVKLKASGSIKRDLITLTIAPEKEKTEDIRLTGYFNEKDIIGDGQLSDGKWFSWKASFASAIEKKEKEKTEDSPVEVSRSGNIIFPFTAFGNETVPQVKTTLFRNATVWTNEAEGIIEGADVLVRNGKIAAVGKNLSVPQGALIIDATGKHLTSGIIDEHSHIAIQGGVNEGTQSITAEVRIEDVVNSEDINIYRQLAGGVTASQSLHGSANTIGGQSALIKLKWGASPEEMKISGADGFIKFALGENVKQSNWGAFNTVRFPQTRMGVEQVVYDGFIRAKEYEAAWKKYNSLSKKEKEKTAAPRKDLEMETLVEILNNKRFISCHSYVQSEINMLMKAGDDLGFKVNTFTHILEGYKLADKMSDRNIGGSTFADWWGYKMEVKEAIPYNAALMNGQGVVTAINSDDAEMGRRLNQEAAKTVKYGGVSEEEAWKFVTLNPAKLLHLDHRMGSIKIGKDADLVLWNDHPLSIYARAEKTMIEGAIYYDLDADVVKREALEQERARIMAKMRSEKNKGAETQKPVQKTQHVWHCEDLHNDLTEASVH